MPVIIGVAGGVASGKSMVSEQLRRLGAWRLDADRAGHEVLEEPAVIRALRDRWGDAILATPSSSVGDLRIDRPAVARIVFADSPEARAELAFLESISHPRITEKLYEAVAAATNSGASPPALVLDAAVMFRASWSRLCDWILFVDAPETERRRRALARGWSERQFAAREAAQEPLRWKQSQADVIIRNGGTKEETFAQVRAFWQGLGLPSPESPH